MEIQKFTLNETLYFGEGARKVLPDEIKNRGFILCFLFLSTGY